MTKLYIQAPVYIRVYTLVYTVWYGPLYIHGTSLPSGPTMVYTYRVVTDTGLVSEPHRCATVAAGHRSNSNYRQKFVTVLI